MRFATLAAFAFASCIRPWPPVSKSAPPDVEIDTPIWIDARFTWQEKKAIERALGTWNRALEGQHRFFIASEDMLIPELGLVREARNALGWGVTFEYDDVMTGASFEGQPHLAELHHGSAVVFYPKIFSVESYAVVALHEMGHVMGLDDNAKGSTLMSSPYNEEQRCIDSTSLDLVAKGKHWERARMRTQCVQD